MSSIKDIIINESVADVLSLLVPKLSKPQIDRLYTTFRFECLETGELWNTYEKLVRDRVFKVDENGRTTKGPNWKEPEFVSAKKYSPD